MSDIFPMHGLKQGDALSPLLFNSVLEYAIKIQTNQESASLYLELYTRTPGQIMLP